MRNISAYESTIWSSLIITVAASVYFFGEVFGAIVAGTPLGMPAIVRLGAGIVVILVAVEVAFQVAVYTWCKGKEPQTDERDHLIAAKSARNGYYMLIFGQFMLIGHLGIQTLIGRGPWITADAPTLVTFMIFALVVAEITHFSSRIIYYRLGA